MRGLNATRHLVGALGLLLLWLGPIPASPAQDKPPKERFVKGELLVTYKESVTECVHCLLRNKKALKSATTDASDSLDKLHVKYKVTGARPLVRTDADEAKIVGTRTASALKKSHADREAAVKARFPRRAARAPKDAVRVDQSHTYVLSVDPAAPIEAVIDAFARDPHVESVQPNYRYSLQVFPQDPPNDPYYSSCNSWLQSCPPDGYDDLWGVKRIQAPQAWPTTQGRRADGQPIVVAVLDSGVDYAHPDLDANIWANPGDPIGNAVADACADPLDDDCNGYPDDIRGWNFAAGNPGNNDVQDLYGHGTHVAGIIAAEANNSSTGVVGVAPQVKLMPVRISGSLGDFGTSARLVQGLDYAALNGADVINNSWGCSSPCPSDPAVEGAVRNAYLAGAVVVFAAGNSGDDIADYSPQNQPETIAVSNVNHRDQVSPLSNYGVLVDVAAPGVQILSTKSSSPTQTFCLAEDTVGGSYCHKSGTSMAAPHVSAAAALLLAKHAQDLIPFTNEDVRQALRVSAEPSAAMVRAAIGAGLPSDGFSLASVPSPLLFVSGPTCNGDTCLMYENASGVFDPLTVTVTAIDLDGTVQWLQYSSPTYPTGPIGSTFQIVSGDTGTDGVLQGIFTWQRTPAGLPLTFTNLASCSRSYQTTFSASGPRGIQQRTLTISLIPNALVNNHLPIARGYVNPGVVGSGRLFTLVGSESCDPDGPVTFEWKDPFGTPIGTTPVVGPINAPVTAAGLEIFSYQLKVSNAGDSSTVSVPVLVSVACFIATAAYGSPMAPELDILRAYRDQVLARSALGRTLVDFYYRHSPPIARFIADKPWLRALVRQVLQPLVGMATRQLAQHHAGRADGTP